MSLFDDKTQKTKFPHLSIKKMNRLTTLGKLTIVVLILAALWGLKWLVLDSGYVMAKKATASQEIGKIDLPTAPKNAATSVQSSKRERSAHSLDALGVECTDGRYLCQRRREDHRRFYHGRQRLERRTHSARRSAANAS
jgi:hypothetical protein